MATDNKTTKLSPLRRAIQETEALNAVAEALQFRYGGPFSVSGHHLFRNIRQPILERDIEIAKSRRAGKSLTAIGRDHGISHQRVSKILERISAGEAFAAEDK